jgi:hypothetical protein
VAFDRANLQKQLADLAARGVFVGTSSWKYPGWRGMVYEESKYIILSPGCNRQSAKDMYKALELPG